MERHVYHQIMVPLTLDQITPALPSNLDPLLAPTRQRAADGDGAVAMLHAHLIGADTHEEVRVSSGEPEQLAEHVFRVPIRWEATHAHELFPVMTGEIEFAARSINPPMTDVSFIGHYRPPLGPLGAAADALVGHRIAREVVEGFLRDFCDRLVQQLQAVPA